MNTLLGRLEKADLRAAWLREAEDFTPWLAQEENLALLGDTIGLDLELESREKYVGPFRADILCKDTVTNTWVLIENQIERTDHSHLGQLLTYAAGLDAVTVIWIAARFTNEHRAALDWLNEVTDESINFFGLEIELWRIRDSPYAPKFNVVSQPNDWTKTVSASRQVMVGDVTPAKQLQLEYWTSFKEYLETEQSFIKAHKPLPQHWTTFAIGRTGFSLSAVANTQDGTISVGLVLQGSHAKQHFRLLEAQKDEVEREIGQSLEWRELPDKKSSNILLIQPNFDPNHRNEWLAQHEWLKEKLEDFHRTFAYRVKNLDTSDISLVDDELDSFEEGISK